MTCPLRWWSRSWPRWSGRCRPSVGDSPDLIVTPADADAFFEPETRARPRRVKAAWDPDDPFAGNHRIPPAA